MQTTFDTSSFVSKQQSLQNLMQQISVLQEQYVQVLNEQMRDNFISPSGNNVIDCNRSQRLSPFALVMEQQKKETVMTNHMEMNKNPVPPCSPFFIASQSSIAQTKKAHIHEVEARKEAQKTQAEAQQAETQEAKKLNIVETKPDWHLASHKLFRDALEKQIFVCLHEGFFSKYLTKLKSIGIDLHSFSKKMEFFLYYTASRLEDYLEYSTLRQRIVNSFRFVKRKCMVSNAM